MKFRPVAFYALISLFTFSLNAKGPAPAALKGILDLRHISNSDHFIVNLNGEWEFYIDIHYRRLFQREGDRYILLTIGTHRIVDRYRVRCNRRPPRRLEGLEF